MLQGTFPFPCAPLASQHRLLEFGHVKSPRETTEQLYFVHLGQDLVNFRTFNFERSQPLGQEILLENRG